MRKKLVCIKPNVHYNNLDLIITVSSKLKFKMIGMWKVNSVKTLFNKRLL